MRSTVRIATAIVLILSLGLHWALLQTIAWTGMIVTYSRSAPLAQAITRTFDGKHPCPLCKAISEARADEKQKADSSNAKAGATPDLAIIWESPMFYFAAEPAVAAYASPIAIPRGDEPPTPPPRGALL